MELICGELSSPMIELAGRERDDEIDTRAGLIIISTKGALHCRQFIRPIYRSRP